MKILELVKSLKSNTYFEFKLLRFFKVVFLNPKIEEILLKVQYNMFLYMKEFLLLNKKTGLVKVGKT